MLQSGIFQRGAQNNACVAFSFLFSSFHFSFLEFPDAATDPTFPRVMRWGVRKRTRTRIEAILADAISSACVHGSSRWGFSDNAASTSSGPSHTSQKKRYLLLKS